MNKKRFASVWDAIEDTPEDAEKMKLLSALRMELKGGTESSPLIASIVETRNTMDKISASLEGLRESVEATKTAVDALTAWKYMIFLTTAAIAVAFGTIAFLASRVVVS